MQYMVRPRAKRRSRIPRLPFRPPADYLRQAMAKTLGQGEVELDFLVKLQTDPRDAGGERLRALAGRALAVVPVAVLRLPMQTFDSPEQLAFADPCLTTRGTALRTSPARQPEPRTAADLRELSRFRQEQNGRPHASQRETRSSSALARRAREVTQRPDARQEEVRRRRAR